MNLASLRKVDGTRRVKEGEGEVEGGRGRTERDGIKAETRIGRGGGDGWLSVSWGP